jgi:hypothetical protein
MGGIHTYQYIAFKISALYWPFPLDHRSVFGFLFLLMASIANVLRV